MLQKDNLVRFKEPTPGEIDPSTGKSIIMKVREYRPATNPNDTAPARVLVETNPFAPRGEWTIAPTSVYLESDLQRVFSAHPHIDIPDFLNTDEFSDESYGNDVTAHVVMNLPADSDYDVWVWVHPDDPAERESADYHKYEISIYDRVTGDLANIIAPDELDSYSADDPDTAIACIEQAKQDIMLLLENKRNREADEKKELITAILSIDPDQYEDGDLYHDACEALGWETDWEFFQNELETATLDDLREMEAQLTIMTATAEDDEE